MLQVTSQDSARWGGAAGAPEGWAALQAGDMGQRRNLVKFVKREVQSPAPGKG